MIKIIKNRIKNKTETLNQYLLIRYPILWYSGIIQNFIFALTIGLLTLVSYSIFYKGEIVLLFFFFSFLITHAFLSSREQDSIYYPFDSNISILKYYLLMVLSGIMVFYIALIFPLAVFNNEQYFEFDINTNYLLFKEFALSSYVISTYISINIYSHQERYNNLKYDFISYNWIRHFLFLLLIIPLIYNTGFFASIPDFQIFGFMESNKEFIASPEGRLILTTILASSFYATILLTNKMFLLILKLGLMLSLITALCSIFFNTYPDFIYLYVLLIHVLVFYYVLGDRIVQLNVSPKKIKK